MNFQLTSKVPILSSTDIKMHMRVRLSIPKKKKNNFYILNRIKVLVMTYLFFSGEDRGFRHIYAIFS